MRVTKRWYKVIRVDFPFIHYKDMLEIDKEYYIITNEDTPNKQIEKLGKDKVLRYRYSDLKERVREHFNFSVMLTILNQNTPPDWFYQELEVCE